MIAGEEIRIGDSESVTLPERRPSWISGRARSRPVRPGTIRIRLREEAFRVVHEQAAASLDEIGGMLIGEAVRWRGVTYVDVEAALPGERTRAGRTHVTFTAETWAELLRRQERELPDKMVVGWYHSHPRMGIFLSEMDLSLHRGFFPQPWHVALVVNGQDHKAGFFAWLDSNILPVADFLWSPRRDRASGFSPRTGEHPFIYEAHTAGRGLRAASPLWLLVLPAAALLLMIWLARTSAPGGRPRTGSDPQPAPD